MWLGRWSKELSMLYEGYLEVFDREPDCYEEIDYDGISYNDFVKCLKKSVVQCIPFPDSVERTIRGFKFKKQ